MLNVNTCMKNYGARRINNWKEDVFKWYIYIFFLLDFPHERVPVILGPLLYPESEDLAPEKLTDTSSMPKSVVS
jgi:hypothetical protein